MALGVTCSTVEWVRPAGLARKGAKTREGRQEWVSEQEARN